LFSGIADTNWDRGNDSSSWDIPRLSPSIQKKRSMNRRNIDLKRIIQLAKNGVIEDFFQWHGRLGQGRNGDSITSYKLAEPDD
jgi:hypothetical protein